MGNVRQGKPSFTSRRTRPLIYYDILLAIRDLRIRRGDAKITPVQNLVNIPSKRFRQFLHDMEKVGLLRLDSLDLTTSGNHFLEEFTHFLSFLEKFGLATTEGPARHAESPVVKPTFADITAEYESTRVRTTA